MVNLNDDHRLAKLIKSLRDKDKIKILFVCLGNICRSPAAEGVMKAVVESAGTGNYHIGDLPDRRMRIHAQRRGYNLTHICRQVRPSDFEEFDLIVAMDASNRRNLQLVAPTPEAEEKIIMMADFADLATKYDHIPDPYYEGAEGFELVLDLLESACDNLYQQLKKY